MVADLYDTVTLEAKNLAMLQLYVVFFHNNYVPSTYTNKSCEKIKDNLKHFNHSMAKVQHGIKLQDAYQTLISLLLRCFF